GGRGRWAGGLGGARGGAGWARPAPQPPRRGPWAFWAVMSNRHSVGLNAASVAPPLICADPPPARAVKFSTVNRLPDRTTRPDPPSSVIGASGVETEMSRSVAAPDTFGSLIEPPTRASTVTSPSRLR